ncbi:MAG: GGDEF domain-containing protein, partial [Phyllobacteriaceae bacterium]|nr:GGDEF domain-containing protein [Phyllobacteriaceae bacterium]
RIRADIAAHRLTHSNDELRTLSEVDTLTGLANRRAIDLRLPEIAERSQDEGEVIGVMMIDVDHFKIFNDRYGHQAGDRCLAAVARATAEQIRRHGDLVGRWGGEEFLAVLPGAGLDATVRVAERIRAAVERRIDPIDAARRLGVTVSIGCAAGVVAADRTIDDLLRAADELLYAAKRDGRNRISPTPPSEDGSDRPGADRAAA